MRKQYHFEPAAEGEGLDAWDVDRLVALSRNLVVVDVELAALAEIDTAYWFDDRREFPTVRRVVDHVRLIEAVDVSSPIILSHDGLVMDGMHRIARAMLEGRATVPAVRFVAPLAPDFRNCRSEDLPYD